MRNAHIKMLQSLMTVAHVFRNRLKCRGEFDHLINRFLIIFQVIEFLIKWVFFGLELIQFCIVRK